jgi:hypothetical protein
MEHTPEPDRHWEDVLLAGQRAGPGAYRNVETGCRVEFDRAGMLPPSFDGRVACYVQVPRTWAQHAAVPGGGAGPRTGGGGRIPRNRAVGHGLVPCR